MPVSKAKECSQPTKRSPKFRTLFDIRFHGQSVADFCVCKNSQNGVVKTIAPKSNVRLEEAMNIAGLATEFLSLMRQKNFDWNGDSGVKFRLIYKKLDEKILANKNAGSPPLLKGQPEHDLESQLLVEFSQHTSDKKRISDIQPITMLGTKAKFQMPTPITASNVKKGVNHIKYSGSSGGGIDILARSGVSRGVKLTVIELKDTYSTSEPPSAVIQQAIAYAVFLNRLLRENPKASLAWWRFFGFGGEIPKKIW